MVASSLVISQLLGFSGKLHITMIIGAMFGCSVASVPDFLWIGGRLPLLLGACAPTNFVPEGALTILPPTLRILATDSITAGTVVAVLLTCFTQPHLRKVFRTAEAKSAKTSGMKR